MGQKIEKSPGGRGQKTRQMKGINFTEFLGEYFAFSDIFTENIKKNREIDVFDFMVLFGLEFLKFSGPS